MPLLFTRTGSPTVVPSSAQRINRAHPITRSLVSCWLPGRNGVFDVAGNMLPLTPQSSAVLSTVSEGPGLKSNGTSDAWSGIAIPALKNWNGFTLFWRGYQISTGSPQFANWLGIAFNNSGGSPFEIAQIGNSALGNVGLSWNTNGTFTQGTNTALPSVGMHDYAGTFTVGGNSVLYIDGVQSQSNAFGATGPTSSSTSIVQIGDDFATTGRSSEAVCTLAAMWNRALSSAEIAWLHREPYSFLLPSIDIIGHVNVISPVNFRKTFSQIGGRVGSRQIQGWAA